MSTNTKKKREGAAISLERSFSFFFFIFDSRKDVINKWLYSAVDLFGVRKFPVHAILSSRGQFGSRLLLPANTEGLIWKTRRNAAAAEEKKKADYQPEAFLKNSPRLNCAACGKTGSPGSLFFFICMDPQCMGPDRKKPHKRPQYGRHLFPFGLARKAGLGQVVPKVFFFFFTKKFTDFGQNGIYFFLHSHREKH